MSQADPIGAIEAAIVARLEAAFGLNTGARLLKTVEAVETPFDDRTAKTFRVAPPACYVTPLKARPAPGVGGDLNISWAVYAVSGRATSQTRTKGGAAPLGLGAYAIATTAALSLSSWRPPVDCAGTMELFGIENLTGWTLVDQKLHVWAATLTCTFGAELINPEGMPPGSFQTFWADLDVTPFEDPPADPLPAARDAAINATLEGG